jgi:lipopolysaccharide/colanic/teichoic acid biosynthesis glycosyltransferase
VSPQAVRFKRGLDVVASAAALFVLSPVLLVIAIAVRRDSPGPALFVDWRVGRDQRLHCYKFPTMCADAPARQKDLEEVNECGGVLFKIREDPRVTRVGLRLRKFSLDELPQLFNILRGDMSLVGPRPLPTRDVSCMEEWHKQRHQVTPGLTGLWQVNGRSHLDFDDMIASTSTTSRTGRRRATASLPARRAPSGRRRRLWALGEIDYAGPERSRGLHAHP